MIISMLPGATQEQIEHVCDKIKGFGYSVHPIKGEERTVIGAIGDGKDKDRIISVMESVPGVESVIPILQPFKLVGRELKKGKTIIQMDGLTIGGDQFVVMAGPCSVEYREQILTTAEKVKAAGAKILRGGAYKPRTSPYDFQGLEEEGLKLLAEARDKTGLKIVTEIITTENIDLVNEYTDIFQVGARNMQNFALLKRLGRMKKPVLLKRGMMSTLKELADVGRVCRFSGESGCDPVRTRHSNVRNLHAKHARHCGSASAQAVVTPACDRRSQPWHWQTKLDSAGFKSSRCRGG